MNSGLVIFIVLISLVILCSFVSLFPQIRLYNAAKTAGVNLKFSRIIGMKLRKTNPAYIVPLLIKANKAGVEVTPDMLETQCIARGSAGRVVEALIKAKEQNIPLEFKLAAAIDLSGGDPVEFAGQLTESAYTEQALREAARFYLESLKAADKSQ